MLREFRQNWMEAVRLPFFTASIVPVILGVVIAWERASVFHWGYFILTFVAGVALQAGTNLSNDYFDHVSGADESNVQFVRPYTGGSRVIQKGIVPAKQMLQTALLCFAASGLIGLYLAWARGLTVLVLGLIGGLSGFFYTAPPVRLVATGLGELVVGLNFGILMTLGSYYVQAQALAWEPFVASLPVACLISAVLYINEFQDADADRAAGKDTLVVRLGRRRAVAGYVALMAGAYVVIVLGAALRIVSPFALIVLLTAPIAWTAVRTARAHYDDYLKLTPANAGTVKTHLLTGLLLVASYMIEKVV